jgi:nitrate/TMAO reductase-like tetraheme cytochrome c subunit
MASDLLLIIFGLGIGVVIVMWFKKTKRKVIQATAPTTKDLEQLYNEYMTNYVVPRLKSPKVATFATFKECHVVSKGNKTTIRTYVDSQNSFGALIRSDVKLKFDNDNNFLGASIKGAMDWFWTPMF